MITRDHSMLVAAADSEIYLNPRMANRHGLILGATGTGKTVTLQTLAESFSKMGVPVFMADVKGDLSGIAAKAEPSGKIAERIELLHLKDHGYEPAGCPVNFFDVQGRDGFALRTTISDLGPLLLSRILNLNEVQSALLHMVFRIADDQGLLLLDLKDLRSMLSYVAEHKNEFQQDYGNVSAASVGAIQRGLLRLEDEGGDRFFGEPALNIDDLLQTDENGHGIVSILCAEQLMNTPLLYSTLLLWLLSELYEKLPERGDADKPRLVFFFDEAHLLFSDLDKSLLQKVEQVIRLIRSKGVGVYFVSQHPADIPDSVLGQLGNRIMHALRAYTPKERKSLKAAADSFRANPSFDTEQVLDELAVGEALISLLDDRGTPSVVERAYIVPPQSRVGPLDNIERAQIMKHSLLYGVYDEAIDRESAYEILAQRSQDAKAELQRREQAERDAKEQAQAQKEAEKQEALAERQRKRTTDKFINQTKRSVVSAISREATRQIKSPLGRSIGSSLMRGILGSLFGVK